MEEATAIRLGNGHHFGEGAVGSFSTVFLDTPSKYYKGISFKPVISLSKYMNILALLCKDMNVIASISVAYRGGEGWGTPGRHFQGAQKGKS